MHEREERSVVLVSELLPEDGYQFIVEYAVADEILSAYVSIRQHTSAYVSMHQHMSACVSMRQHTSAYVS